MHKENQRETKSLITVGRGSSPGVDRWGNPGCPSTSWPPSQEVVSQAAEKSNYLLLPVPPIDFEKVCVWLLKRFKSFE